MTELGLQGPRAGRAEGLYRPHSPQGLSEKEKPPDVEIVEPGQRTRGQTEPESSSRARLSVKNSRTAEAQLEEPHPSQAASPNVLVTEALPGQTNRSVEWSRTEFTRSTGIKTPYLWLGALGKEPLFQ